MYYIQETDKPCSLAKLFNKIETKENKIILPIIEEKLKLEKAEKLGKKTIKILNKANCNTVVISRKIKKQKDYINYLHSNDAQIVNGRWLFKVLTPQVLDYIIEKQRLKKEEIKISILINDLELNMLEAIKQIIRQYKVVNIVTNHFEKFRKIEEQILEEEGVTLAVTNNKRKSLIKSDIILNVDFPNEVINKYRIYENAIIVNLRGNVQIKSKRFNGICIENYEIEFANQEEFDEQEVFERKDMYESLIQKNRGFKHLQEQFVKDKVRIKNLRCNKSIL